VAVVAVVSALPVAVAALEPIKRLSQTAWKNLVVLESKRRMPWADMVAAEYFDFARQIGVAAGVGGRRHAIRGDTSGFTVARARHIAREASVALKAKLT